MRLRNRLLTSCAVILVLGLMAGAAQAGSMHGCSGGGSPDDPFGLGDLPLLSGNGELEFSNFRFHSPSCSVDPSDLEITILEDGVEIGGSITLDSPGWFKFYVSYEVTAVDALIDGASLELGASVGSPTAAVFANKRVIGEEPDWRAGHPWNHHGWGHLGWGLLHRHQGLDDGQGKTLAFLETAEWEVDAGCLCKLGWGWLCEGDNPYDEQSFDPQESVKVIDAVWIKALRDGQVDFDWSRNRFTVVPEPATAVLVTLGLLGLAVGGRRI